MSTPRYRAWQFLHPDVDVAEMEAGLHIWRAGGIAMVEEQASVRQAIFMLLSTVPGERVMRPEYGCYLYQLIFSPNDDTTAGLAIYYVQRAIELWEPRIDIMTLDAGRNPESADRLDVTLEYRLRATQQVDLLTFSVSLAGENI